jgi:hypothetical protein
MLQWFFRVDSLFLHRLSAMSRRRVKSVGVTVPTPNEAEHIVFVYTLFCVLTISEPGFYINETQDAV